MSVKRVVTNTKGENKMKVTVNHRHEKMLLEDIECGRVFTSEVEPTMYMMRTDSDTWPAIDIKSGVLYHVEDFDRDNAQYYYVDAETTIEA